MCVKCGSRKGHTLVLIHFYRGRSVDRGIRSSWFQSSCKFLAKWLEILDLSKTRRAVPLWWRDGMNFMFEWEEQCLRSKRSERRRYCSGHESWVLDAMKPCWKYMKIRVHDIGETLDAYSVVSTTYDSRKMFANLDYLIVQQHQSSQNTLQKFLQIGALPSTVNWSQSSLSAASSFA